MIPAIQPVTLWDPDMSIYDRKFAERQGGKPEVKESPSWLAKKATSYLQAQGLSEGL